MTPAKVLLFLLLAAVRLTHAQRAAPAFEVATIKPAAPSPDGHTHINYPPDDRFSAINITLPALMQWAYDVPQKQILDGPAWLSSTRFDIQAKVDPGEIKALTSQQITDLKQRMLQALFCGALSYEGPPGDSDAAGLRPGPG